MRKKELHAYLTHSYESTKKKKNMLRLMNGVHDIDVQGFSDFFIDVPAELVVQYSNQSIKVNDQNIYLSLYEKTTNFNQLPANPRYRIFNSNLVLNVDFTIKEDVKSSILILFYDDSKLLQSEWIACTGQIANRVIEPPKGSVFYRIAIKLEGKGQFQINRFKISQQPLLSNISTSFGKVKDFNKVAEFKEDVQRLKYYRKVKDNSLKVASILDEFSEECFKYDCDLLPLSKDHWREELDSFYPSFLLVESCWQGNKGTWAYEVANLHKNEHRTQLKELTDYCKIKNIKTVFWDKEGLENFDFFKEASSYFDYIFTADENNIPNFKEYTNNENVFELPFAAQPQIHNPMYKNRNYMGQLAFAGSYYNNKHDLRKKDITELVKSAIKYDVEIFDRYFGTDPYKFPNNQWPEEYKSNIIGSLQYGQMVEAYKNYDIFLNVNSVQDSKNMFARRVFEVLASKTMVVSGPSIGVEEIFNGIVPIIKTSEEADTCYRVYTKNPALRERLEKEGARLVYKHHTYKNRLQEICDKIDLDVNILKDRKVTIVSSTNRPQFIDNLYESVSKQTYENLELVIVLNNNQMDEKEWSKKFGDIGFKATILKVDEGYSLGHCLNEAISHASGDIISKFDDDDYYAPNYVTDMVHSMEYSNADIVGKSKHYLYFEDNSLLVSKQVGNGEEIYSDFVAGATLVFTKDAYEQLGGFTDRNTGEDSDFLKRAKENGFLIYSSDAKNYCCIRRRNKENHTWKIDDTTLLRSSVSHLFTTDYKTPITF